MANAIMAGSVDITSAQHGYRLVEMAEIASYIWQLLKHRKNGPCL